MCQLCPEVILRYRKDAAGLLIPIFEELDHATGELVEREGEPVSRDVLLMRMRAAEILGR